MSELQSFDRVAEIYDQTRAMPPEAATAVADGLAAIFRDAAPAPHILETGIGTGRIAVPLAERGVRITGVDIAPKMVARLREKAGGIDVVLAEAARLPFRDGSFDGALFVHILHLVPDAGAVVAAAIACVRRGGVLVYASEDSATGPHAEAGEVLRAITREVTGAEAIQPRRHQTGREAFEREARAAGMQTEERALASWDDPFVARTAIDLLARRVHSGSWQIPDAALPEVVRRLTAFYEQAFGDLDAVHPADRVFRVTLARRPG